MNPATTISKKITRSEVLHAITAVAGIVFTTAALINFYYSTKVHKLTLKEKSEKN